MMSMEKKELIAQSVRGFRMPRYQELPDVGLYLEQTTKYLNGFLAPLGCIEITASMISNYVKKGLIPSPVKKQYHAEHLAYLFFIAITKQLVSIENIMLLEQIQKQTYPLDVSYDYFAMELENMVLLLFGVIDTLEEQKSNATDEKDLLHGLVFSAAHMIYMNAQFAAIREKRADQQSSARQG